MLGSALIARLSARDPIAIDRRDGPDIGDRDAMRLLLTGCGVLVHLAAIHPLVASLNTDYDAENVVPFGALLDVAQAAGSRRVIVASSTAAGRAAPTGRPCRVHDEAVPHA